MDTDLPPYFENVLDSYARGDHNRCVHLGYYPPNTVSSNRTLQEAQEEFDDRLLKKAALLSEQKILDVGCGLGGLIGRINSKYNRMDVVGSSNDPRQLEICNSIRPRNHNSIAWVEADACVLPFPSGSFDRVFCIEAAFHFRSRQAFYAEAYRVLKPGGRLLFTDIFLKERLSGGFNSQTGKNQSVESEEFESFFKRSVHTLLLSAYAPWPDPWYAKSSLLEDLTRLGFESLEVEDWTLATAPSYQAMIPSGRNIGTCGTSDPMLASLLTLDFLHQKRLLDYVLTISIKSTLEIESFIP